MRYLLTFSYTVIVFIVYTTYSFSIDNLYDLKTFKVYNIDEVISLFHNKSNLCYSSMVEFVLLEDRLLKTPVNWSVLGVYFMKSGYDYHSIQCMYLMEYLGKGGNGEALDSILYRLLS